MPSINVRFPCKYCGDKVITITLDEVFQQNLKKKADKWPYPVLVPHSDHWAIVYIDQDMHERSVVLSRVSLGK